MSKDIVLFGRTGEFPYEDEPIEKLRSSTIGSPPVADRPNILANKVLKYFLTEKGSDPYSPEYGSNLFIPTQMADSYIPKFKMELVNEVKECASYFKKRRGTGENISIINIKNLRYRSEDYTTKIEVILEVITTKNRRARVTVGN